MSVLIKTLNSYTEVWTELSTSVISDSGGDPTMQIKIQKQIYDDSNVFVCNIGDPVCISKTFSELLGLTLIPAPFPAARAAQINTIIAALAP